MFSCLFGWFFVFLKVFRWSSNVFLRFWMFCGWFSGVPVFFVALSFKEFLVLEVFAVKILGK